MACEQEKITFQIWESIKEKWDPKHRRLVNRIFHDEDFIGSNRIIHKESGNFMCYSPNWLSPPPGQFFFYVMGDDIFCFTVEATSRPQLKFHWKPPAPSIYSIFCAQVSEVFGIAGFNLSIPGGWKFVPQFPVPQDDTT
jgi:hypothetical protein